ncbi:cytochrome b subunit of succinate dehydrogenase, Sdh3p [Actinomortierella wolfii]|nr:cytochrome b subunit of succinate dehydrogenase, Sdh3p [Actinomortierella wolfii]KAG0241528.1 cytochrome b subunit of succinate dehydrogenase, Sdh3p [Actinomortierella wolfii]
MFATRAAAPLRTATQTVAMSARARIMAPVGTRIISTSTPNNEEYKTAPLIDQRKNRPLSPHITHYQPQLTWVMSGFHRFTGGALAAGFYAGAIGYAVGLPLDSATIVSTLATVPLAVKIPAKLLVAFPFTFHFFNGIRHLVWDTTRALTLKGVYQTGYTVLGLSTVSALGLAFL